jgi:hypothetical protein
MARSFNEKMEKKRQAEYNRWKAEITGCLSTKKIAHGRIAGRIMWS